MRYTRPLIVFTSLFVAANIFLLFQSSNPYRADAEFTILRHKKFWSDTGHQSPVRVEYKYVNRSVKNDHPPPFNSTLYVKTNTSKGLYKFLIPARNNSFVQTSRIVRRDIITYQEFNITEPHFITDNARRLFYLDQMNRDKIGVPSKDKLLGEIFTVRKGTFAMPYDCGYRSNMSFVLQHREIPSKSWYRSLVPMMVPDGGTFQHFLDGTLPKIIQALDYIQQPQVFLLMPRVRDQIILEILERLNISRNKIVTYSGSVGADYLIFTCVTPPLHPKLWQKARSLLGVPDTHSDHPTNGKIVVITRKGCFNCGRKLLNKDKLVATLQGKYPNRSVEVFRGPLNLKETIELFSTTKVVVGTHGGGLYNINFCPSNTTVIEIMPTYDDGRFIAGAHQIFWHQSVLLGQQYWRLPAAPENSKGDVNVDVSLVIDIIERSLKFTS